MKFLALLPVTAFGLVACGNQNITESTQNLTDTLNQVPSAAPSINLETGNKEVDGLVAQVNELIQNAWNWGLTTLQGLIDQIPVLNQLV